MGMSSSTLMGLPCRWEYIRRWLFPFSLVSSKDILLSFHDTCFIWKISASWCQFTWSFLKWIMALQTTLAHSLPQLEPLIKHWFSFLYLLFFQFFIQIFSASRSWCQSTHAISISAFGRWNFQLYTQQPCGLRWCVFVDFQSTFTHSLVNPIWLSGMVVSICPIDDEGATTPQTYIDLSLSGGLTYTDWKVWFSRIICNLHLSLFLILCHVSSWLVGSCIRSKSTSFSISFFETDWNDESNRVSAGFSDNFFGNGQIYHLL